MSSSSATFELYLLGSPRIKRTGQQLRFPRRKALGLLAYLAFTKQAASREALATLLWPNHDDSHARGSLRRLLSETRRILGQDLLPVKNEWVGPLDPNKIRTDIDEFQSLMAKLRLQQRSGERETPGEPPGDRTRCRANKPYRELLQRVVALYKGDFLSGFTIPDCAYFSEWQFLQGEYLRRELCTALEQLVDLCEMEAEEQEGIDYGRKLVEVDPLNEEAHCALMRLYAAGGHREAALKQYRLCKKILMTELSVEPEDATTELYQAIRTSRPVRFPAGAQHAHKKARLVILPLKCPTDEQEWFSDGMTDALITELSRSKELEIISYASAMQYRDTRKNLRQVAAELDVDHLLTGSVLKVGTEVRISMQLIEAASDRNVWA
jgi:DNA-binding SARP family transcriptional activator